MYVSNHKSYVPTLTLKTVKTTDKPRVVDFEYPSEKKTDDTRKTVSTATGSDISYTGNRNMSSTKRDRLHHKMWVHPQSYIDEYLESGGANDPDGLDRERSWTLTALSSSHYRPTSASTDMSSDRTHYDVTHAYMVKRMTELDYMTEPGYTRISGQRTASPRRGYENRVDTSMLFNKLRTSIDKLQKLTKRPRSANNLQSNPFVAMRERQLDDRRKLHSANAYMQYKRGKNDVTIIAHKHDYSAVLNDVLLHNREPEIENTLEQPANTPRDTPELCRRNALLRSREKVSQIRAKSAPHSSDREPQKSVGPARSQSVMVKSAPNVTPVTTPRITVGARSHAGSGSRVTMPHIHDQERLTLKEHIVRIPTAFDTESLTTGIDSSCSVTDGNSVH